LAVQLFESEILLGRPRREVFPFFADAHNLEDITPPFLRFRIVTSPPVRMEEGALIDYRLRLRGVPLRWRTRISRWDPPRSFVDEQVEGPFRVWIHEHTFEEVDGGTRVRDRVRYAVPGGWIVDRLFVRREVERIFSFRRERLRREFGEIQVHDI
jgi:ligand-binding SRPBCC domain-containing protein